MPAATAIATAVPQPTVIGFGPRTTLIAGLEARGFTFAGSVGRLGDILTVQLRSDPVQQIIVKVVRVPSPKDKPEEFKAAFVGPVIDTFGYLFDTLRLDRGGFSILSDDLLPAMYLDQDLHTSSTFDNYEMLTEWAPQASTATFTFTPIAP